MKAKRWSVIVMRLIGACLLIAGVISAFTGPAETVVFRLFREGGRFHYEGFGFGSLMFANIVIQIAGYYVIAVLFIPLGHGHFKSRWWTLPVMKTLLIDWLIVGLPFSLAAVMILLTSKPLSAASIPFIVLGFILIYPLLPLILLKFYRSGTVRDMLQTDAIPAGWLSEAPQGLQVATSLMALFAVTLHFPLLLGGLFPVFGRMVGGLAGVLLIDFSIVLAIVLAWGLSRRTLWAWLGSMIFLGILTSTIILTFLIIAPRDVLAAIPLAPTEAEALSGIPLAGYHIALITGLIPLAVLVTIIASQRSLIKNQVLLN